MKADDVFTLAYHLTNGKAGAVESGKSYQREQGKKGKAMSKACPFDFPSTMCERLGCTAYRAETATCMFAKPDEDAVHRKTDETQAKFWVQVCAWCGEVLQIQPVQPEEKTTHLMLSHGICERCANAMRAKSKRS